MNRYLRFIFLACLGVALVGCLRDRFIRVDPNEPLVPPIDPTPRQVNSDVDANKQTAEKLAVHNSVRDPLAAVGNTFAADLFRHCRNQPGNLVLSPASIHSALCMTYLGARDETARQMAQVLHVSLPDDRLHQLNRGQLHEWNALSNSSCQLSVANHLWGQKGIYWKPEFLRANRRYYDASLSEVNFVQQPADACRTINGWVNAQTRGKIPSIVSTSDVSTATRMVLTNAVYFQADWASKFDKNATNPAPFYMSADRQRIVAMMRQTGKCAYAKIDGATVVELPYAGERLGMVLILPDAVDGIEKLEVSAEMLNSLPARLQTAEEVELFLPRFQVESRIQLQEALSTLGMRSAFESGQADFSGMSDERLFLSSVIHRARIETNEEGSEAAAATAAVMSLASAGGKMPVSFRADHPFVFLVRDRHTGSVLFLGRISDPS
jgi:serine protease inhibitor